ncbi:unnamed protein product, partial [Symbiodinium microadriaticum]
MSSPLGSEAAAQRVDGGMPTREAVGDDASPEGGDVDKTVRAEEAAEGNDADHQSGDVEDVPPHEVRDEQAAVAEAVPDADALELEKVAASDSKTPAHTSGDEEPKK